MIGWDKGKDRVDVVDQTATPYSVLRVLTPLSNLGFAMQNFDE